MTDMKYVVAPNFSETPHLRICILYPVLHLKTVLEPIVRFINPMNNFMV